MPFRKEASTRLFPLIFAPTLLLSLLAQAHPAISSVADFYSGKQITLLISTGPGGGYDLYGRLLSSYMGRHIPGAPTIIPRNQPGAGGLTVANYAYNQGPNDGTLLFTLHVGLPLHQALDGHGVQFDAAKIISIGRLGSGNAGTGVSAASGVRSFKDVLDREIVLGATQPSSNSAVFPKVAADLLGAKIRVVTGYKSMEELMLAMQRGEVAGFGSGGIASMESAYANYELGKDYFLLFQWGLIREPKWTDVPLASELASNPTDRKALEVLSAQMDIGRSYYLPPKVPTDRVGALRAALKKTTEDPGFQGAAQKARAEISYLGGPEMEKIIADVLGAPKEALTRLKAVTGN
jgi:tripartite-type tricarboxylate transporter receptor subunit TctC